MQGGGGSWRDRWETLLSHVEGSSCGAVSQSVACRSHSSISNFHDPWLNVENEEIEAGSLIDKTKRLDRHKDLSANGKVEPACRLQE